MQSVDEGDLYPHHFMYTISKSSPLHTELRGYVQCMPGKPVQIIWAKTNYLRALREARWKNENEWKSDALLVYGVHLCLSHTEKY